MARVLKNKSAVKKTEAVVLTKDKEMVKFEIAQIRQISIQAAIEATAISILSMFVFIGAPSVFPEVINPYDPSSLKILQAIIILPAAYWAVAILGNFIRLWKINRLQKYLR